MLVTSKKFRSGPRLAVLSLTLMSALAFGGETHSGTEQPALYDRLGGWDGIAAVVETTIGNHLENPTVAHLFEGVDLQQLAVHVTAFFAAGSGGPEKYTGRDMTSAHAHLKMTDEEFHSGVNDVLKALHQNNIGEKERDEVEAILLSLKPAVLGLNNDTGR